MASAMDEDVELVGGIETDSLGKCRVHGLLYDTEITEVCPLCESDRVARIDRTT